MLYMIENTCGVCMRESRARPRKHVAASSADSAEDGEGDRRGSASSRDGDGSRRTPRSPAVCAACHTFLFEQIKRYQQLSDGQTPLERNDNNHRRAFADFYETVTQSRSSMRSDSSSAMRLGSLALRTSRPG